MSMLNKIVITGNPDDLNNYYQTGNMIVADMIPATQINTGETMMLSLGIITDESSSEEFESLKKAKALRAIEEEEDRKEKIKEVVLSVQDSEKEFAGNIVLYTGFRGSIPKKKILSKPEREEVMASVDPKLRKKVGADKPLFGEFKAMDAFEKRRSEWRLAYRGFGIPYIADGMTLVRITSIPDIEVFADLVDAEMGLLVDEMLAEYPTAMSKENVGTGFLYNPADYTDAALLKGKFKHVRKWQHFGVPDILKEIDEARWQKERQRTAEVWAEVKQKGIFLLREQVAELTSNLADSLTDKEDGTKKKFFTSTITKIDDFFESFDRRNLGGDAALKDEIANLRNLVAGKDIEKFRTDDQLRARVREGASRIQTTMKGLLVDAESRVFDFD